MRTPAGKECRHYYEDFHRGRNIQECRLIKANMESLPWRPVDCSKCPVPDILNANASPLLTLKLTIKSGFLGFGRRNIVEAFCRNEPIPLEEAYTGCDRGGNRPGLDLFRQALEQSGDDD
ncbi:MAG: hypothetical protein OHK0046_07270 [Anaerolineae bacterium]